MVGHFDGTVTLPRIADVYEALGRFLRDLNLLVEVCSVIRQSVRGGHSVEESERDGGQELLSICSCMEHMRRLRRLHLNK